MAESKKATQRRLRSLERQIIRNNNISSVENTKKVSANVTLREERTGTKNTLQR